MIAAALGDPFRRYVDQGHGNAGVGEAHGDAAAHRAGTDHRRLGDGARFHVGADAWNFCRLALGEEHVAQRLRLVAGDKLQEERAFRRQPFVDRHVDGIGDGLGTGGGGVLAAPALEEFGDLGVERRAVGADLGQLVVAIADQRDRLAARHRGTDELDRGTGQIGIGDRLHQPVGQRFLRRHRLTGDDALDRLYRPDDARQPLGAAGTGQNAELHLRQPQTGASRRDPQVARQREFEAAAERRTVHRRDRRLADLLERDDHFLQDRMFRRLAEFGDVGAGAERPAGAGENDRFDRGVGLGGGQGIEQARAHGMAERVHWRIVDRDDGDVAVTLRADHGCHDRRSSCFVSGIHIRERYSELDRTVEKWSLGCQSTARGISHAPPPFAIHVTPLWPGEGSRRWSFWPSKSWPASPPARSMG